MRIGKRKRKRTESIEHVDLGAYVFDHIEKRREILLNNIFGVDLNEESVEITKLSLFLKVCRINLKLQNLDKNIKNGNSIIDDPHYTDKPFNWEGSFPISKEGRFDIVIGNPPYVRQEKFKEIKSYLKENYEVYAGAADLYVYFFEKGISILKDGGLFSFICSDKFTKAKYGKNLRKFILNYDFKKYLKFKGKGVFEDATVDPCVLVIKKTSSNLTNTVFVNDNFQIPLKKFNDELWNFENPEILNLKTKIGKKGIALRDIEGLKIYFGIKKKFKVLNHIFSLLLPF